MGGLPKVLAGTEAIQYSFRIRFFDSPSTALNPECDVISKNDYYYY